MASDLEEMLDATGGYLAMGDEPVGDDPTHGITNTESSQAAQEESDEDLLALLGDDLTDDDDLLAELLTDETEEDNEADGGDADNEETDVELLGSSNDEC